MDKCNMLNKSVYISVVIAAIGIHLIRSAPISCELQTFEHLHKNGTTTIQLCSTVCSPEKSSSREQAYCSKNCLEYSQNCLVRSTGLPSVGTSAATTETTVNAGQSSDDITTENAGQLSDDSTVSKALVIGLCLVAAVFAAVVIVFLSVFCIRRKRLKLPTEESGQNQLDTQNDIQMQEVPLMSHNVDARNQQQASQIPAADGQQTQNHAAENSQNNQGPSTREESTDATTGPEYVTVLKQPLDNG